MTNEYIAHLIVRWIKLEKAGAVKLAPGQLTIMGDRIGTRDGDWLTWIDKDGDHGRGVDCSIILQPDFRDDATVGVLIGQWAELIGVPSAHVEGLPGDDINDKDGVTWVAWWSEPRVMLCDCTQPLGRASGKSKAEAVLSAIEAHLEAVEADGL